MNKALGLALMVAASVALAACASADEAKAKRSRNPAPCPNVLVLAEASRMIEFDGEEAAANVAYSAEIEGVALACRYFADEPIDATVDLKLAFGRGPKSTGPEKSFSYFVAVTRTNREVIAKKTFTVDVDFKDDAVRRVDEEIDEIVIPRASEITAGGNFEIIVGLVLSPEQAIFNRSGKSLKFPEL